MSQSTATRLDDYCHVTGTSKQDVIQWLIETHLPSPNEPLPTGQPDAVTAHTRALNPPLVLTVGQAAELLKTMERTLVEGLEAGDVPGRMLGGEWRLSQTAILEWLRSNS